MNLQRDRWVTPTRGRPVQHADDPLAREMWMTDAACAQIGGDAWFPIKGEAAAEPKRICWEVCTVREQCLEYAIRNGVDEGIWGGVGRNQRRALRSAA